MLVGRKVVVVANLKPRQMKFGLSEGMILAAAAAIARIASSPSTTAGAAPRARDDKIS